ncbi:tyrosine-type recombinase/integrase [Streptomyces sp.]|uniref:tyrosine-type recombinase/integrase n=1 Tax=Streptomyces sp. TaxID=1931 RepID=UPI002F94A825
MTTPDMSGTIPKITDLGGDVTVWTRTSDRWTTAIDDWTEWMRAESARPATVAKRRYQVMRFAEAHLGTSPWKITTGELVTWLSQYEWKPETRRSYRAALRSFYKWARTLRHVRANPAEVLPSVRPPKAAARPTPDRILDSALFRCTDRDRLVLLCAAYAGMRRAEIAGFRWDWIEAGVVRIVGKGGRVRQVPLHPTLRRELDGELARRDAATTGTGYRYTLGLDEYVFPGQHGGPMDPDVIGKIGSRALAAKGWTLHTLRHRFATRAYALGGHDLLAVQDLLGHASPETTRRYTQTPDGALSQAVAAV